MNYIIMNASIYFSWMCVQINKASYYMNLWRIYFNRWYDVDISAHSMTQILICTRKCKMYYFCWQFTCDLLYLFIYLIYCIYCSILNKLKENILHLTSYKMSSTEATVKPPGSFLFYHYFLNLNNVQVLVIFVSLIQGLTPKMFQWEEFKQNYVQQVVTIIRFSELVNFIFIQYILSEYLQTTLRIYEKRRFGGAVIEHKKIVCGFEPWDIYSKNMCIFHKKKTKFILEEGYLNTIRYVYAFFIY